MDKSLLDMLELKALGGDLAKIYDSINQKMSTTVICSNYTERIHISSGLDKKVLYVTLDRAKAREAVEAFGEFGKNVAMLVERDDMLVYRKVSSHTDTAQRTKALYQLANGKLDVLVCTVDAIMQYLPTPKSILSSALSVAIDQDIDKKKLSVKLADIGYNRVDVVEEVGDFSISGDMISIFGYGESTPITISLFDTVVESIKTYDINTRKSIDKLESIDIFGSKDSTYRDIDIASLISKCKKQIKGYTGGQSDRAREILQELSLKLDNGEDGFSWLAPYAREYMCTIERYLDKDSVLVLDDPVAIYDHAKMYYADYQNRCTHLIEGGEVTPEHKQAIRDFWYLPELSKQVTTLGFASIVSSNRIYSPMRIFKLNNPTIRSYFADINALFRDVKNYYLEKCKVVLCCGDEYTARSIVSSLYDSGVFADYTTNVNVDRVGVQVTPFDLSHGLCYPKSKTVVIGRYDITKKREIKKSTRRSKTNVFTMPKVGDYVVHDTQGIGICSGVEQIESFGVKRDFVVISYAGADKLYIPVDQMDKLQRYSGSDVVPKVNKLGGREFQKLKERVKESVKEMAFDLLELYKSRQNQKGYKYPPDTVWQQEFEDSFEYEETDDQLRAIGEIKADMENGVIMDRLLCGDVGYGKTEVALRAVFKTVMEGKQAAILAPTTILARQHFVTASERFVEAGIKCALLSRFQTKQEIAEAIKGIKSGDISVVIATHRLLSKDIEFKDLGLLVLDEEQRFGVEDKEKMKALNNNINVLTLSATPIPRTLNMALTGIRDISVLETPPKARIPIETYVTELTDGLLIDAISREIERGGQVYVLYNRVDSIDKMASGIESLVPEAKVIVGHGQMTDHELESTIDKFYNKEVNVLVCTTIIENGINLPDANTLIVCDADRLGLSALYQLRGRVGRSDKRAYAYFTTRQGKVLTSDAMKRLTAIMDYTDFGSGFKIAMRDLEIRGAGNVLGREQHGHIAKVGYDMYCKLLQEAVEEVNGSEVIHNSDVQLKVDVEAYLDSEYITSNDEKINIYKNIAELASLEECADMVDMLRDRYGEPSDSLINLMKLAVIKNMASRLGASEVNIKKNKASVVFDSVVLRNKRVITAVSDMQDICSLDIGEKISVTFGLKMATDSEKISIVLDFLKKCSK